MNVVRTFDNELVKSLVTLPELWETIAEDGQEPESLVIDCESDCWLLMVADEQLVGLYKIHALNVVTVQIHAHVFPEFRKQYSKETGQSILKWIYDNTDYQKIVAEIPVIYENVKRFTCSFGFKHEGINRKSYLKNGHLVDQHRLGMTREELAASLVEDERLCLA